MDLHIFARALLAQTQHGTSGDSACTLAVHVNVADFVFTTAIASDACLIVIRALQNQVTRTILGTYSHCVSLFSLSKVFDKIGVTNLYGNATAMLWSKMKVGVQTCPDMLFFNAPSYFFAETANARAGRARIM